MTQAPPFDPTMFGGDDDVQPQPATVAWEALNANDYRTTLEALGQWLQWLVPTYRIPPSVVPPCWFLHTGLIEELGHLWTGWQVTRHPESGVGMVGLDWDNHRERAITRLRELVGTGGCNGTQHCVKPDTKLTQDHPTWQHQLHLEAASRTARCIHAGAATAIADVLKMAEQRNGCTPPVRTGSANARQQPTQERTAEGVDGLDADLQAAVEQATRCANDARRLVQNEAGITVARAELVRAREELILRTIDGSADDLAIARANWAAAVLNPSTHDAVLRSTTG